MNQGTGKATDNLKGELTTQQLNALFQSIIEGTQKQLKILDISAVAMPEIDAGILRRVEAALDFFWYTNSPLPAIEQC